MLRYFWPTLWYANRFSHVFCSSVMMMPGVVREPAVLRFCLCLVQKGLQGLDVADGVPQDLHLGQALVRDLGSLLAKDLEGLVHLRWVGERSQTMVCSILFIIPNFPCKVGVWSRGHMSTKGTNVHALTKAGPQAGICSPPQGLNVPLTRG